MQRISVPSRRKGRTQSTMHPWGRVISTHTLREEGDWIGPSQGQLDPTKEVQAAVTAIENGLSNREAEAIKLNGSEYRANVEKLTLENERLREANGGAAQAAQPAPEPEPEQEELPDDKQTEGGENQNGQT